MNKRNINRVLALLLTFSLLLGLCPAALANNSSSSQRDDEPESSQTHQDYTELDISALGNMYGTDYLPNDFFENPLKSSPIYESEPNDGFSIANTIYDN